MADAGTIRAGKAAVELMADPTRLIAGLKVAEGKLKSWSASIASVGSAIAAASASVLAPVTAATMSFAQQGNELLRMASRTGASVESLSTLRFAAERAGIEFDALGKGIGKMQEFLHEARMGSAGAALTMAQLGLSLQSLRGMTPDDQFRSFADAIGNVADASARAKLVENVFGKAGDDFLPLFRGIGDESMRARTNLRAFEAEARSLGLVISEQDASAARELSRQMGAVTAVMGRAAFMIGAALTPSLLEATAWIKDLATGIGVAVRAASSWIAQNRTLVTSIFRWASAAGAAAAGMLAASGGLVLASKALGVMIPLIAPLLSLPVLFTGIGASLIYMGGTMAKVGIAIISTVAALQTMRAISAATVAIKATWTAAVAGLTAAYAALTASIGAANAMASGGFIVAGLLTAGLLSVAYASQTSGHAADNLGNIFRRVSGDMTKAWGGMLAAIQGGDLEGALQIGWGGLKVVVAEVIGWAQIRWSEFVNALPVELATAWQGVANAIGGAITALVNGLFNMLGGLRKYFSQVSEDAMAMWDQIANGGSGVAAIRAAGQAERQQIDKETAMLRGTNEDIENRNRADRQSTVDQATQEAQGNVQNTRQGVDAEIDRLRAEQQRSIDDRMWALAEARGTGGPAPDSGARPPGLAGVAQSTFSAAGGLAFVGGGGVQNPQRETTQAVRRVEGVLEKLLAAMQRGFVLGA